MLGERLIGLLDEQPCIPAEFGGGEATAELARTQLLMTLVVTDKLRCLDVDVVEPRLEDGAVVGIVM